MHMLNRWFLLAITALSISAMPTWVHSAPRDVAEPGFKGRLYPAAAKPAATAVIVIGGSEGGLLLADDVGPQIAKLGYMVLGVDYHDGFNPGRRLANVPVETFIAAADWLVQQPGIARVVVAGESRGSEAALLTALRSKVVAGAVAYVPSSHLLPAVGPTDANGPAAWSEGGKPLPFVKPINGGARNPQEFKDAIKQDPDAPRAAIPIENIPGKILLLATDDDAIWDCGDMVRDMTARHAACKGKGQLTARIYPNAGHRLFGTGPSAPTETYTWGDNQKFTAVYGGTAQGNLAARTQAWQELTAFLRAIERSGKK
jgi:uncharacterized protein